ncbi:hypothetical protein EVAR_50879_1 [Eumeta japonica]|uniref:Uncharacterized protein n=1 Tax=Eumeta variegata TaxID=151549 RepID=A0A4C1Y607_EUMVA|nr:hypothetical protein EVAR_50879_1 [Eumeta japonica]
MQSQDHPKQDMVDHLCTLGIEMVQEVNMVLTYDAVEVGDGHKQIPKVITGRNLKLYLRMVLGMAVRHVKDQFPARVGVDTWAAEIALSAARPRPPAPVPILGCVRENITE